MEYIRVPLSIEAQFLTNGSVRPKRIILQEESFEITRVIKTRRKNPLVVPAIAPIEYTVLVEGYEKKIYFERDTNSWFSVKKIAKNN
ncbi:MAG: hypothetical protein IJA82_00015 [Clostridia bacterium]|nr:hypothetical protein [Clostridia bacterium]